MKSFFKEQNHLQRALSLFILLAIWAACFMPPSSVFAQEEESSMVRIIVGVSPNARMAKVSERTFDAGFQVIQYEELDTLGAFIVETPAEYAEFTLAMLQNISGVRYAELDGIIQAADVFPDDPYYSNQYALNAIRAPQGWGISTGAASVTIAIIDSGVDYTHPDLAGKIDAGHDFIACPDSTDLLCAALPQDDYGHGTHVAGIAAATSNNGVGVAGVSWGARIMPVKVLDSIGDGTYEGVAAGIVWAVDNGAQVINLSLGGSADHSLLYDAVEYAYNNNVLVVAAAGNSYCAPVLYPARYPQVMAVGATNTINQAASFTNCGPEVDVAAPGDVIYNTCLGGGYCNKSGTSMSTPHVSGLAAILLSHVGGADAVRDIIESTAYDVPPAGRDMYTGAGLIQMDAALKRIFPPTPTLTPTATFTPVPTRRVFSPPFGRIPLSGFLPTPTLSSQTPQPSSTFTASPFATFTFTPTIPAALTDPELSSEEISKSSYLYLCSSFFLILIGILLFLWGRKNKITNL